MRRYIPPVRSPGAVFALLLLLTILPGCDSYNLSFKDFYEEGDTPLFDNIVDLAAYLAASSKGGSPAKPAAVRLNFSLAGTGWTDLLNTISGAGKYVSLDLSDCDMAGMTGVPGQFNPNATVPIGNPAGKDKIVSLVLPNAALSITGGSFVVFANFDRLKKIEGANVQFIGQTAFSGRTDLASASFPSAVTIEQDAFYGCTALTSVNFPAATNIGPSVFSGCIRLISASIPAVGHINVNTFSGCIALTHLTLDDSPPGLSLSPFGVFSDTGPAGTLYIHVPSGTVSAYMSSWGVVSNPTPAGSSVYGNNHKTIIITAM
ncbi:MAG: leucine-rich repeat domain-containing protein [Treponema sp.]|jgi:hypothetical protein|nr:leucine-rich repeat domain-containing protein [Treponema sp.]